MALQLWARQWGSSAIAVTDISAMNAAAIQAAVGGILRNPETTDLLLVDTTTRQVDAVIVARLGREPPLP